MALLLLSLLGGILTILSPCVLPLLPVIVGGSVTNHNKWRPVIITASLSVSLVLFTLALKWSTAFIAIHPNTWSTISGGLVVALGIITLFPRLWESFSTRLNLSGGSNKLLGRFAQKNNWVGAVLVGFALGPVFSSCSPTYALILATVLPQSFFVGLLNLIAYAVGLSLVLLLIAVFGQRLVAKLKWAANPEGWFKRVLGVLFIVVGLLIIFGVDKKVETYLVEQGFGITALEEALVEDVSVEMESDTTLDEGSSALRTTAEDGPALSLPAPIPAPELTGLTSWINSNPTTLAELKGKVVVVDFWTYSCINCIRTLPFLNEWHEKYADDGLVILGVHAPEFAFERVPQNVQDAVTQYGIGYPVALDNDFSTWRAYSNRYWPAKYFIDREGHVRHTHFGEGEYEESEEVIRYLLAEGGEELEDASGAFGDSNQPPISREQTSETYLGHERAAEFANTDRVLDAPADYTEQELVQDHWTLDGRWTVEGEHVTAQEEGATLSLRFSGKDVYLVAAADATPTAVQVKLNGEAPGNSSGADLTDGSFTIDEPGLYHIISGEQFIDSATVELIAQEGVQFNAFTFGS